MPETLLKPERQERILRFIGENAQATVTELGQSFRVSEATIRRDLEELSQGGLLRRTHGGALRVVSVPLEVTLQQRTSEHAEEKQSIGRVAAELIADGETVIISSGTTTVEVARALVGKRRVTVITNALNIINTLVGDPNIPMIVLGGFLRRANLSLIGHFTELALRDLRADKIVLGAFAFHPQHGLTDDYLPEMMTGRSIMRTASQVIVVADHSKLGRVSTILLAPVTTVHTLVTDAKAPGDILEEFRKQGLRVIVA